MCVCVPAYIQIRWGEVVGMWEGRSGLVSALPYLMLLKLLTKPLVGSGFDFRWHQGKDRISHAIPAAGVVPGAMRKTECPSQKAGDWGGKCANSGLESHFGFFCKNIWFNEYLRMVRCRALSPTARSSRACCRGQSVAGPTSDPCCYLLLVLACSV